MKVTNILKNDFTFDFFQKSTVYPFFDSIKNNTNNNKLPFANIANEGNTINYIHVISDIPPYFDLDLSTNTPSFKSFKIKQYTGFLADLKNYQNIDAYLKDLFGAKSRSRIRGQIKRLENCFQIRYQMYYGQITKEEFDQLFDALEIMIERRFSQRGDTHLSLEQWDIIKKNAYPLILNKKASFFVIYNKDKPIDICLNYHYQNIMNNLIRSYDIDYSKFRLGYIDIYKQIEWCIQNEYQIFDLSRGEMLYKRQWCNTVYRFKCQIIYDSKSKYQKVLAFLLAKFYSFKEYLKDKKLGLALKKLISFLGKNNSDSQKSTFNSVAFEISPLTELSNIKENVEIDINTKKYDFLRKPVHDFQFDLKAPYNKVKVYLANDATDSYYVQFGENAIEIKLQSQKF